MKRPSAGSLQMQTTASHHPVGNAAGRRGAESAQPPHARAGTTAQHRTTLRSASDRTGLRAQVLNPAETFGDIIVDYSYVECSSACITALAAFAARHPGDAFYFLIGFT